MENEYEPVTSLTFRKPIRLRITTREFIVSC